MASTDYYAVLGVSKTASADEIRQAHRKLARRYHPDVSDAPESAKKFQQIQEAYDVLGDEEARRKYDRLGHRAYTSGSGENPWGPGGGVQWGDMGGGGFGSVIEEIFGGGRRGAQARSQSRSGQDAQREEHIPFDLALTGGEHTVRLSRGGSSQAYAVRIPKGASEGTKLRVRGAGHPSRSGGPPGDLIIVLRLGAHPLLSRDGLDLSIETPLTIAEATLGATVELPTPAGRVSLTIPPGTPSGAKLRLKGRGVEDDAGRRGDLYAVVKIVTPENLGETDRALLAELATRLPSPRTGRHWNE